MSTYLIEVMHDKNKTACDEVINVFRSTGSHFLANADFGCEDDEHKAWIAIDVESKDDALRVVPPQFRDRAKAVKVKKFALEKVDKTLKPHHK